MESNAGVELAGLIRLVVITILSTLTTALQANPDDMSERTREHGLCFTTEQEGYALLGCYERLGSDTRGEVFEEGYITLIPVPGDVSTAASCLEGCAMAVPRNTAGGNYSHMAVSEGKYGGPEVTKDGNEGLTRLDRRCLCGTSLSERARRVDASLCDAPCPGDSGMSCGGGVDYALVYALDDSSGAGQDTECPRGTKCGRKPSRTTPGVSCPTQTASAPISPASSAPPTTSAPCPPRPNPAGERIPSTASSTDTKSTVAVVLGSITSAAALCGVALLLVFIRRRRKPSDASHEAGPPMTETKLPRGDTMPTPPTAPTPPSTADGRRASHVSALTSASGSWQPSRGRQDVSPADTEPSNPASLVVLNASHVVVRPAAGRVSVVDARGSPKRSYSLPGAVPKGGIGAGMRAPGYAHGL